MKEKNVIETIKKGRYLYYVNAAKGVVCCTTEKTFNDVTYLGRGISRCNLETDTFNKEIGMELAKLRAIQDCNKIMWKNEFEGVSNEVLQRKIDYWTYLLNMKVHLEGQKRQVAEDIDKITRGL